MTTVPLNWVGTSQDDFRKFPRPARRDAAFELHLIVCGEEPTNSIVRESVGSGVREIKVRGDKGDQYCVMYVILVDNIYILHAFENTTLGIERADIEVATHRYMSAMNEIWKRAKVSGDAPPV